MREQTGVHRTGITMYLSTFMLRGLFLATLVYKTWSQDNVEIVRQSEVIGFQGKHFNIPCSIATGSIEYVRWSDLVNNIDRDPIVIFDSQGNPSFGINNDHPKKINFMVETDYTLEIVFLEVLDYGDYICEVKKVNDSKIYQEHFQLSVLQQPMCEPPAAVVAGQVAEFQCEMEYGAFSLPSMDWYDGAMTIQSSVDNTEIGKFIKSMKLTAKATNNGEKFTCKAGIAEKMQSCTITMQVTYPVGQVDYTPKQDKYRAGEKITCIADGNPAPAIVWRMKTESGVVDVAKGSKLADVEIKDEWIGQDVQLYCSASNEVQSIVSMLNKTLPIFQALERPPTPEPTPPASAGSTSNGGVGLSGVIGGLIAAAIVIIIIIAIVYIIKKRNSKKSQGAKPLPTKDPEENHRDDFKGNGQQYWHGGDMLDLDRRPYNPPPSDPRYRNMDGLHYPGGEIANNNDDDNSPWKKMNSEQYANLHRP